ncbi:MAG TPA: methylated-DNA--[protein]-cysteine S-methyltransferase [Pirellulales bacterium]|nr:methylated-DNA--[protein]-cysteine S-methyltransferase [Pirellulales bacterium]
MIRFDTRRSKIGEVLVAVSDQAIVAILLGDRLAEVSADLARRFPQAFIVRAPMSRIVGQVVRYVNAPRGSLDVRLEFRGTAFQQQVWNAVRKIPAGQTSSYSELARQIGRPRAVRAVGTACAKNNHAFAVPCHRVLHKDGSMSWGEAWGKQRQQELLALEEAAARKNQKRQRRKVTPLHASENSAESKPPALEVLALKKGVRNQ